MASNALTIAHLLSIQQKSRNSDQRIATYLLNNSQKIYQLTLNELAEETEVSYATICRFFKKLDISGFKEFKDIMRKQSIEPENIAIGNPEIDLNINPQLTFSQISNKICDFTANVIKRCNDTINMLDIEKIARILDDAEFIYFIGLGTSAITAKYAYTKFFRIKPTCSFDSDVIVSKMKASIMTKKNVLFVVSSSGRTKNILDIARIAKTNGATVISLSDFSISSLASISDVTISTTIRESNKFIDTDFPLIQGQITIIDVLYSCLYQYTYQNSKLSISKTLDAINNDKERFE